MGAKMIELVGMLDSPFVRRVAIALTVYEIPFQLNPLSVYSNSEQLAAINPMLAVPVLRSKQVSYIEKKHFAKLRCKAKRCNVEAFFKLARH
jgi:hypothetical protein